MLLIVLIFGLACVGLWCVDVGVAGIGVVHCPFVIAAAQFLLLI